MSPFRRITKRTHEMIDWQPIETAPKDRAPLILFTQGSTPHTGSYWVGAWEGYWMEDVECREIHPTHWCALHPPGQS